MHINKLYRVQQQGHPLQKHLAGSLDKRFVQIRRSIAPLKGGERALNVVDVQCWPQSIPSANSKQEHMPVNGCVAK